MTEHAPALPADPPAVPSGFSHVDTWIFDLDNTLYPHEAQVWPQVDARITLFLTDMFGLDGMSARALQKYYYHRYGTSLKGLMQEHAVDPKTFLDFAHDIDLQALLPDPDLGDAIAALKGRKLIMTNGTIAHAANVAGKLGFYHHFEAAFGIIEADYIPKPERAAFQRFFDLHRIDPTRAAMFEDIEKNLVVPHELGMQTVLILPKTRDPFREAHEQEAVAAPHIQHVTSDLTGFLRGLGAQA